MDTNEFNEVGHEVVDLLAEYLGTVEQKPVFPDVDPKELDELFAAPLPQEPASFTDPGWTPYFLNAAAIVMDTGGMLSHGSIVAREYGIPCVVNVGPATKIIKTGDTVRVDGKRGVVTIVNKAISHQPSAIS